MTPKEAAEKIHKGQRVGLSQVDGSIADVVREGNKLDKELPCSCSCLVILIMGIIGALLWFAF